MLRSAVGRAKSGAVSPACKLSEFGLSMRCGPYAARSRGQGSATEDVDVKWSMNNERCKMPMRNPHCTFVVVHFPSVSTSFIVHGPFDICISRTRTGEKLFRPSGTLTPPSRLNRYHYKSL